MSRFRDYMQRYRFLMYFYIPALFVACWEMSGEIYPQDKMPNEQAAVINHMYLFRYSKLNRELYPNRVNAAYFEGLDELMINKNPQAARKHFERALASGVKTEEKLHYFYAYTLALLDEDPALVNQAVHDWRINHPHSTLLDPRKKAEQDGITDVDNDPSPEIPRSPGNIVDPQINNSTRGVSL